MLGRYVCSGIFSLSPIEYCCGEHRRADAERRPSPAGPLAAGTASASGSHRSRSYGFTVRGTRQGLYTILWARQSSSLATADLCPVLSVIRQLNSLPARPRVAPARRDGSRDHACVQDEGQGGCAPDARTARAA